MIEDKNGSHEVEKNQLGTLNGCYVPCLLNIFGVILFLRLGWSIGQAGVANVLLIFLIAETCTLLTVLSLSAILTNGAMKGGGSYFMISRTLGPAFGGAVGVLFWIAYAVGASFYVVGFAEEVRNTWMPDQKENEWLTIGIASAGLAGVLLISLGGARYFTKINVALFVLLAASILMVLFAQFTRSEVELTTGSFHKWSYESFKSNWHSDWNVDHDQCGGECGFALTMGILFPAATGIMEGANLSGDLANATKSIPFGTLSAVFTAIIGYGLLIVGYAGCADRTALQKNLSITQEIAWSEYFIVMGVIVATMSSALGAVFGGSRVLQAIARDDIFGSWFRFLGCGTKKGDEPIYAVFLTWAIAQACCFLGNINVIAPIISSFFCLSYATVNLSCFLLEVSGTPNFRPAFKYYSRWTAMLGFVLAMFINFFVDPMSAGMSIIIMILFFIYIIYKGPAVRWGDVTTSLIFHQVRKYLLRLDADSHNKLWRPSVLLLLDKLDLPLIDFCNSLKKGGLYVIGNVIVTNDFQESAEEAMRHEQHWTSFIEKVGVKAFPKTAVAPTMRVGYQNLLRMGGLGALKPNTVVLPLLDAPSKNIHGSDRLKADLAEFLKRRAHRRNLSRSSSPRVGFKFAVEKLALDHGHDTSRTDIMEFLNVIRDVLVTRRNVVIAENFESFDSDLLNSEAIQKHVVRGRRSTVSNGLSEPLLGTTQAPAGVLAGRQGTLTVVHSNPPDMFSINAGPAIRALSVNSTPLLSAEIPRTVEENESGCCFSSNGACSRNSRKRVEDQTKRIDVWVDCTRYSWNLQLSNRDSGFPALMMQLAFVISQNPTFTRNSQIRALLLVEPKLAEATECTFRECCAMMRLELDQIVCVSPPVNPGPSLLDDHKAFTDPAMLDEPGAVSLRKTTSPLELHAQALNQKLREYSRDTYITFLALPEIPAANPENVPAEMREAQAWLTRMLLLSKDMANPLAFVLTGEHDPVISTAM